VSLPLPEAVANRVGELLGSSVIDARTLSGGYTPQQLRLLTLADQRTAVLKAASPQEPGASLDWTNVLRDEIRAYRGILP
jgi:hypothetical protein